MLGHFSWRWPNIQPKQNQSIVFVECETANNIYTIIVGLMLGQRRRRWPNIKASMFSACWEGISSFMGVASKPDDLFFYVHDIISFSTYQKSHELRRRIRAKTRGT